MISTLIHQTWETPVLIKGLKIGICFCDFCGYFRCATRVCLKYTPVITCGNGTILPPWECHESHCELHGCYWLGMTLGTMNIPRNFKCSLAVLPTRQWRKCRLVKLLSGWTFAEKNSEAIYKCILIISNVLDLPYKDDTFADAKTHWGHWGINTQTALQ